MGASGALFTLSSTLVPLAWPVRSFVITVPVQGVLDVPEFQSRLQLDPVPGPPVDGVDERLLATGLQRLQGGENRGGCAAVRTALELDGGGGIMTSRN